MSGCSLQLGVGYPWLGILDGPAPAVPPRPAPLPAEPTIWDLLFPGEPFTLDAPRPAKRLPIRLRQLVHNHGPAEGAGLDCPESLVDGQLRGRCLDQPRERWRYLYRTDGWTGPLDVWELVANPGAGRQVGNLVAVSVPA